MARIDDENEVVDERNGRFKGATNHMRHTLEICSRANPKINLLRACGLNNCHHIRYVVVVLCARSRCPVESDPVLPSEYMPRLPNLCTPRISTCPPSQSFAACSYRSPQYTSNDAKPWLRSRHQTSQTDVSAWWHRTHPQYGGKRSMEALSSSPPF